MSPSPFTTVFETERILVVQTPKGWTRVINKSGVGAAAILPVFSNGDILMVKEERWTIEGLKPMWNIPRGGAKNSETTQQVAQRELTEETGINLPLKDFIFMASVCPENGILLNNSDIYIVKIPDSLVWHDFHRNDETIATKRFSHEEIAKLVAAKEFTDAWTMTALGLMLVQKHF